jgi:hypothetical protein
LLEKIGVSFHHELLLHLSDAVHGTEKGRRGDSSVGKSIRERQNWL